MISASTIQHWIVASNFGGDGYKLDDDRELEIEALLDATEDTLPRQNRD